MPYVFIILICLFAVLSVIHGTSQPEEEKGLKLTAWFAFGACSFAMAWLPTAITSLTARGFCLLIGLFSVLMILDLLGLIRYSKHEVR